MEDLKTILITLEALTVKVKAMLEAETIAEELYLKQTSMIYMHGVPHQFPKPKILVETVKAPSVEPKHKPRVF